MAESGSTPISIAAAPHATAPQALPFPLVLGLGLATSMQFYTFDSINLILPDMAGSFGASRDEASWILISYSAALFLGTPLSSYFARQFGLRSYLIGSALVFVAASICCSLATRLEEMIVFRCIEGFAGGSLNFWWRGSVYMMVSGSARSAVMMRISMMLYCASVVGLLVSGFLVDHLSWRYVCVLDILFAAGAVTLLLRHFPRRLLEPERMGAPIDFMGAALLAVALVSLQIVLNRGEIDNWFSSPLLTTLGWTAVIALVLFVFRAFDPANPNPLLRLWMLRDRNVLASVLIGIFTGMILAGAIYALPEYLRTIDPQPRSASQTGRIICIYAITAGCLRPLVTFATPRFGQRKLTTFALVSLIASMLLFARLLTTGTPAIYYAAPLVLYGACVAPLLSAVGSGTAARVPLAKGQIDAVSIYMTFRQFGTALGVALVNIVIDRRSSLHSSRLFEHLQRGLPAMDAWVGVASHDLARRGGRTAVDASAAALRLLQETSARQTSVLAFADAFRVMAVIGMVALALVPLMSPPPRKA